MKSAYTYTILRYVHDIATGESLNVGVVLYAPGLRYLGACIHPNYGRLRAAFPSLDGDAHRYLMQDLQRRFDDLQLRVREELPLEPQYESATQVASSVLPKDDSSLQWSAAGGGLSVHPAADLQRLYERMVVGNETAKGEAGRPDDAIWSVYRAPLARAKVLPHLQPHQIEAEFDEVEFEHAWKNDQWHCLRPISFDLLDAENIKAKAHRLLGQMMGVRTRMADHRLYLLLGEPQLAKCKQAAERALKLLTEDLPVSHEIIREEEADDFSMRMARQIERHLADA